MSAAEGSIKQKAFQGVKEGLLLTLYLWAVFGLLVLHRSMILAENHISFTSHGLAIINALALAKVMLVVRHLHLGDQFKNAPLIYPTVLKSALYTVVLACFKTLEDAVIGFFRHESFRQSFADFGGGTWQGILTLALLVFAMLIPLVGYGELRRVLGEGKLEMLFFRPRPSES